MKLWIVCALALLLAVVTSCTPSCPKCPTANFTDMNDCRVWCRSRINVSCHDWEYSYAFETHNFSYTLNQSNQLCTPVRWLRSVECRCYFTNCSDGRNRTFINTTHWWEPTQTPTPTPSITPTVTPKITPTVHPTITVAPTAVPADLYMGTETNNPGGCG